MLCRALLTIFLLSISWPCAAQYYTHPTPEDARALILQLQNSQPDTNRVHILVKLGNYYFNKINRTFADVDSTSQLAQKALTLSLSLKFSVGEGESYLLHSGVCRVKLEMSKGKEYV